MRVGMLSRRSVPATLVTLSDFVKDQTVVQRVGTSKQISISGTSNGSHVNVQVIDAVSGSIVASSSRVRVVGGIYSGQVNVPQGGWYKLRASCYLNSSVNAAGSNRFGVGIVVGMAGQSNMNGLQNNVDQYPLGSPLSVEYVGGFYRRVGNINDSFAPNTVWPVYSTYSNVGNRADGFVYLANLLVSGLGVPVCLINRAANGSSITQWQSGQINMANLASAVSEAGGDMELFLWFQGESDAASMSKDAYKANLGNVHALTRQMTGRSAADFNFGVISLGPGSYNGSSEGDFGKIRAAHVEYATESAGAFYAGGAHDTATSDGVHITGEGQGRIGRRAANASIAALSGLHKSGPRIISAVRSGAIVTLTVQHRGGTNLKDGAGGSGSALTGFKFFDNGVEVGISASAIASATTIQITLSSAPSGALTVSYGMENTPHGTASAVMLASAVYDDQAIYGMSVGMLLEPLQSMIVV